MDLTGLTIKEARIKLDNQEIKAIDLANAYLKNIQEKNREINAYLEIFDDIQEQAERAQKMIDDNQAGALTGIPLAIKDNILIKNRIATGASKVLENYQAPYSATVSQKLIDQGAIFLGRTNMDEFAMGSSTENSAYGATKNPIDSSRVPGGSSGGSTSAVAMNGALGALGSDTGGSIRQPASFCGVVGLKPTYGSVSRHGLMAMASSLDVIGPISKTVEDAEIIFNEIKGIDPMDATSRESQASCKSKADSLQTIGVPRKFIFQGLEKDVLKNFEESLEKLKKSGYKIVDIDLPSLQWALATYYIIMPAEVSSNMARYDGIKYGQKVEGGDLLGDYLQTRKNLLGDEVKRRILLGTYVLSAGYADEYYYKAVGVRQKMREGFDKIFQKVDLIATPTTPNPAFKIGENTSDPMQMYLQDIYTVVANLVGIPAISIPSGTVQRDNQDLPLGFQLLAPCFGENSLFEVGKKL